MPYPVQRLPENIQSRVIATAAGPDLDAVDAGADSYMLTIYPGNVDPA